MSLSFSCCICEFKTNNEEDVNYHYLWTHNQWRGNCESPNKINIKTEADNIIKRINDIFRYRKYHIAEDIAKLVNRLKELNWALPDVLYKKKAEWFMAVYEEDTPYGKHLRTSKPDYSFSKKGALTQREFEDKQQAEEDLVKQIVKEIDEEKELKKQNKWTKFIAKKILQEIQNQRAEKMIRSNEMLLKEIKN